MSILKCLEFHDLNDERSALFAGTHNIGSGNTALILYAYINPIGNTVERQRCIFIIK